MSMLRYIIAVLILSVSADQVFADAVDIEVDEGEGAVYILQDDGTLHFSGRANDYGFPSNVDAVDLTLTRSGNGYYVVEADGTVHSFGDAVLFGQPVSSRESVVNMELTGNGFYFLREDGSIVTVGDAVFRGFLGKEDAVDIEITEDGMGYYVLYADGTIAVFGSAVSYGFTLKRNERAVDLELVDDGYYVLIDDGTVLNFGNAVPLPSVRNFENDVTAMAITFRGFRLLDDRGNIESFFQLGNQGTLNWFAQSNTVLPQQINTPTPRPVTPIPTVRPTATPRASDPILEIEERGFSAEVVATLPQGVRVPPGMTTGQVSLGSGDTFIVTEDEEPQTARSILLFRHEDFGRSSNEGELFAALNPERGEAEIKGISFSRLGLIVVVQDVVGTQLLVIEGPFDDSSVRGFSEF